MAIELSPVVRMGMEAKKASHAIAALSSAQKNDLLMALAEGLEARVEDILKANARDRENALDMGTSQSMLDRLFLDEKGLRGIADDVRAVAALPDPVGEVLDGRYLDSGLSLIRRRVPLGVVATIYEARPNVTVDVTSLCLKTGNAVILRGGKETVATNAAMVEVIRKALEENGLPMHCVQAIIDPDRQLVAELLRLDEYVDMLIPRGGAALHKLCRDESRIPVITGGIGVCHIVVDESANQEAALNIIENAKVQKPSACNAVETILAHRKIAEVFLPKLAKRCDALGIILHAGSAAQTVLQTSGLKIQPVQPGDYEKEWLSLDCNVEVVDSLEQAIDHIRTHGTAHSDAILTEDMLMADIFVREVDSAAVFVNASTRFTDGGQFGLGAEVAVSTQKLHARGPLGLEALTTYKWIGTGRYTIRQ